MKISIKDTLFSHAFSSSNWFKPENFEWDFKNINHDYVILTDDFILNHNLFNGLRKFAWLVESPSIRPNSYDYVRKNGSNFEKIFTYIPKSQTIKFNNLIKPKIKNFKPFGIKL